MKAIELTVGTEIILNVDLSKWMCQDIFDKSEMASIDGGDLIVIRVDDANTISSKQLSDTKWTTDEYKETTWSDYINIIDEDGWMSDPEIDDNITPWWCDDLCMAKEKAEDDFFVY